MPIYSKNGQDFYELPVDIDTSTGEDKNLSGAKAKGYQQYITVTKNGNDYFNLPATPENLSGSKAKGYSLADEYDAQKQTQTDLKNKQIEKFSGAGGGILSAMKGASDWGSFGLGDMIPAAAGATSTAINKLSNGQDIGSVASGALQDYDTLHKALKQEGDVAWNVNPVAYGIGAAGTILPGLASSIPEKIGEQAIKGASLKGADLLTSPAPMDAVSSLAQKFGSGAVENVLGTGATLGERFSQGAGIGMAQGFGQGDSSLATGDISGTINDTLLGGAIGGGIPVVAEKVLAPTGKLIASGLQSGAQSIVDAIPAQMKGRILNTTQKGLQIGEENPMLRAQLATPEGHELVQKTIRDAANVVKEEGLNLSKETIEKLKNVKALDQEAWTQFENKLQSLNSDANKELASSATKAFDEAIYKAGESLDPTLAGRYVKALDGLKNNIKQTSLGDQVGSIIDLRQELNTLKKSLAPTNSLAGVPPDNAAMAKSIMDLSKQLNDELVKLPEIGSDYAQRMKESGAFQDLRNMVTKQFNVSPVKGQIALGEEKGAKALQKQDITTELINKYNTYAQAVKQSNPELSQQLLEQAQKLSSLKDMKNVSMQPGTPLEKYAEILKAKGNPEQANIVSKMNEMIPSSGSAEDLLKEAVPKMGTAGRIFNMAQSALHGITEVPLPHSINDLQLGGKEKGFLDKAKNIGSEMLNSQTRNKVLGSSVGTGLQEFGRNIGIRETLADEQAQRKALYSKYMSKNTPSITQSANIGQTLSNMNGKASPALQQKLNEMSQKSAPDQAQEMLLLQQDPVYGPEIRKLMSKQP